MYSLDGYDSLKMNSIYNLMINKPKSNKEKVVDMVLLSIIYLLMPKHKGDWDMHLGKLNITYHKKAI